MTTNLDTDKPEASDISEKTEETSETRRRLLRAGLAAAPLVMAIKSRSVLACGGASGGGGIKQGVSCSAFASVCAANAKGIKLSHQAKTNYPCKSPDEWKACPHPAPYAQKQNCYFHDKSYKIQRTSWGGCGSWGGDPKYSTSYFTYSKRSGCNYTGFPAKSGSYQYGDKTLQEMLYCSDPLTRNLVAVILNKCSSSTDPNNILPSQAQCIAIWNANGVWTPVAGQPAWTKQETLDWLNTVLGCNCA